MVEVIIRGKRRNLGRTRSEEEQNLRKEWGRTITDEQLDKAKFLEKKIKEEIGAKDCFVPAGDLDKVK